MKLTRSVRPTGHPQAHSQGFASDASALRPQGHQEPGTLLRSQVEAVCVISPFSDAARVDGRSPPSLPPYLPPSNPLLVRSRGHAANMKVITAIYLHCRPDLRDEWLTGVDVDADVEESLVRSRLVIPCLFSLTLLPPAS